MKRTAPSVFAFQIMFALSSLPQHALSQESEFRIAVVDFAFTSAIMNAMPADRLGAANISQAKFFWTKVEVSAPSLEAVLRRPKLIIFHEWSVPTAFSWRSALSCGLLVGSKQESSGNCISSLEDARIVEDSYDKLYWEAKSRDGRFTWATNSKIPEGYNHLSVSVRDGNKPVNCLMGDRQQEIGCNIDLRRR